ncbi:MAG TPA: alkaline phosphatase family protein [Streptosporangiaceae bacterium]|nr:alkaline phosphatase family protein [Streptosporangiaceae bacterium]
MAIESGWLMARRTALVLGVPFCAAGLALAGCGTGSTRPGVGLQPSSPAGSASRGPSAAIPRPAHTVVVIFENHSFGDIIGNSQAGYLNKLARQGALFTASYGVTHPSEPNYLALFSGSTHGVTGDQCPVTLNAPNLATDLMVARMTFAGYAEGLPAQGSPVCGQGNYARKHAPWTDFTNVPAAAGLPYSRFPTANYARLPTVSFVVPDLCNDMHDCSVATGDAWLRSHLSGYAQWAKSNNSLLIVTWDEDDGSQSNRITTIFVGQRVVPGRYGKPIDHYNVLRTIEQAYGLPFTGQTASHYPITWIWRRTR